VAGLRVLLGLLLLVSLHAKGQSDFECGRYAVFKEARGESRKVQRAVLDTIQNRARKANTSLCKVLRKPQQFPYFKYGVKRVDKRWHIEYNAVLAAKRVLSEDYIYFNTIKSPWGTGHKKLGNLWFAK
jgi:hypothetical protein